MTTRREFVVGTAAIAATVPLRSLAEVVASTLAADPLRPQCHLMPPRGWMNDPNGPIVWGGQVHLFYQVNPHGGADWGDIAWGHAVSPDMVHWRHMPMALVPEPGIDRYGVFSGSCVKDGGRCLAFYTAVAPAPTPADVTLVGSSQREQQAVAVSTDPDLRHWTKQARPVISKPPLERVAGFRDPQVWRDGSAAADGRSTWWMIVGSGQVNGNGCVLLYKANVPDGPQADWTYVHELISAPGNGRHTADTVDAGTMWECPDLFALDGTHVLLYSSERKVYWMTGELTPEMKFVPKKRGLLDTGAYYAPKSMSGPHGERVLWGWIPEKRDKAEYIAAGWAGCMALPRVLHVDANGMLRMRVAPEADALLMGAPRVTRGAELAGGRFASLALKIKATLPAEDTGFVVLQNDIELLRVHRISAAEIEVNGQAVPAPSPTHDELSVWVDGSVIEIFFGDLAAHTVRSYPKLRTGDGLNVVVAGNAAAVSVQPLQPVSANRLTS